MGNRQRGDKYSYGDHNLHKRNNKLSKSFDWAKFYSIEILQIFLSQWFYNKYIFKTIKALLSHRYGSRSLPTRILESEYNLFQRELKILNEPDLIQFNYKYKEELIEIGNILEECYELDNNEIPARYRLKHLDRLFPKFNQKVHI